MKKNFKLMLIAVFACTGTLTGCSESKKAPQIKATYQKTAYSVQSYSGMNWYISNNYTIELFDDNSYIMALSTGYSDDTHEDVQDRMNDMGCFFTMTYGTYTTAPLPSEGSEYLTLTLNKADRVTYSQWGKVARSAGVFFIDSDNWDEKAQGHWKTMAEKFSYTNSLEGFKAVYGCGYTCTIIDPSLKPEDTSLIYSLETIPEKAA